MNHTTKELLFISFQRELSQEEKECLNDALSKSETMRIEQKRLEAMHQILSSVEPVESSIFTDRVMHAVSDIHQKNKYAFSPQMVRYLSRIAAACLILIGIFIADIYRTEGTLTPEVLIGLDDLSADEAYSLLTINEENYE
jgi:hypothetical protein